MITFSWMRVGAVLVIVILTTEVFPDTHPTITVITSNTKPVAAFGFNNIHYLNLDAVNLFEQELSRDLPSEENKARDIVNSRITTIGQEILHQRLLEAYRAVFTAIEFDVDRYPAIIFDSKFVVYGVTDVGVALQKYYTWYKKETNENE